MKRTRDGSSVEVRNVEHKLPPGILTLLKKKHTPETIVKFHRSLEAVRASESGKVGSTDQLSE